MLFWTSWARFVGIFKADSARLKLPQLKIHLFCVFLKNGGHLPIWQLDLACLRQEMGWISWQYIVYWSDYRLFEVFGLECFVYKSGNYFENVKNRYFFNCSENGGLLLFLVKQ